MDIGITDIEERNGEKETGPVYDVNNVPLNYIVVIDSGSKGTRAFIYSWETPKSSRDGVRMIHEEHWNKKVQPSIDNLVLNYWNDKGNLELYFDHLMYTIYKIVPREQHFRTPIFFHGTAGLRILEPKLQSNVMNKICSYLQSKTNFFLPDCESHINIISGETEALYSWVAVNYLKLQDKTEKVNSFGVFALGGGSAQIAFEPSSINAKDHIQKNLLYGVKNLPLSTASDSKIERQLYLDSFVKLGFNHFHQLYLQMLVERNDYQNEFYDPCLPNLFTKNIIIGKLKCKLKGTGDFNKCQSLISQLFSKNINSKSNKLLKDHAPLLNLNNNDNLKFIAVTGYWDTVSKLLNSTDLSVKYNYDSLTHETKKICSMTYAELNALKHPSLSEKEFINLCFKSNYVLELIENGFNVEKKEINNLIINDQMGLDNTKFSWTLGKAYLYAVDESNRLNNLPRTEIYKNISPSLLQYGSEQDGIELRPSFELFDKYEDYYVNFDDEDDIDNKDVDDYIEDNKSEDSDWSSWWSVGHYFNSTLSIGYDDGSVYNDEMEDGETIQPNNLSLFNKLFSMLFLMLLLLFVFKKPVSKTLLYTIKWIKYKTGKLKARNKRYHYLTNEIDFDDEYNIEGDIIPYNINNNNKYNSRYTNMNDMEPIPYNINNNRSTNNNNNSNNNNNNNNNNDNKYNDNKYNNNKYNILSNSGEVDDMHLDFTNISRRDIELKTFDNNDDDSNATRSEGYDINSNSNNNNDDDENGIDSGVEFSDLDDGWDSDGIERAV